MVGTITTSVLHVKQPQWQKVFHMFYIEPIVFILVFAYSFSATIMKNEVIYQTCITIFYYNESDCIQLGTKNTSGHLQDIETEVQPYVANLFMIRTLLESIVPAFCVLFIGSWSDQYGRKPVLLLSMIGFFCTYAIAAVIRELSRYYVVNPWWYILAVVPQSALGGYCVFSVAAFCYISDVTDTKTRPYRMISFEVFLSTGLMVGSLLSSYVYAATNATIVFAISGILMCLATAYIGFYVPESLQLKNDSKVEKYVTVNCKDINIKCEAIQTITKNGDTFKEIDLKKIEDKGKIDIDAYEMKNEEKSGQEESKKSTGLFSYVHIKDMWITCFKKRPYYDRCIILLVTGTMLLSFFVLDGAMTVFYLFVREKFHWTIKEFTIYETIMHITSMFGALVGFLILRKVFNLSVVTMALIALFSDMLRSLITGLATESWHLYLAIAAGILKSVGGPMCRTIISNIVPPTDLGKIFSIKNILQTVAPFMAAPLYTIIYRVSLTNFPGLFNIVSAVLFFIGFVFLSFILRFKIICKDHYSKMLK